MRGLRRAAVYGMVAGVVAAVYFGLLAVSVDGLVAALAAGALFHPVRQRLRPLFGVERDPYRLADRLSRSVQAASGPGEALASGAVAIRQTLGAAGVLVEVDGSAAVADGSLEGEAHETKLVWHGLAVGRLTVVGERPDPALVDSLARHLAEVAHAVRLTEDLRGAHERLLAAREEERGRLLRVLQDGLGVTLTGLVDLLGRARGSADAGELLLTARTRLADAVERVRDLVYGMHLPDPRPPAPRRPGQQAAARVHDAESSWSPRRRAVVVTAWAGALCSNLAVAAAAWFAWRTDWAVLMQPIDPIGTLFPPAGAFLITYRPRLVVAWLMWSGGLVWALYSLALCASHWMHLADQGNPAYVPLAWFSVWAWVFPVTTFSGFLPMLFPDGRLPSARWRPVWWGLVVLCAGHSTLMALMPNPELEIKLPLDNPVGVEALGGLPWLVETHIGWVMVPLYSLAVLSLAFRYRAAGREVRGRIVWFVGTMAAYMAFWVARVVFADDSGDVVLVAIQLLLLAGAPISIVASVVRHGFYGIRVALNRTLVYVALAALLAGAYTIMIWAGDRLAGGYGPVAGLAATLAVGAVSHPLRVRLEGMVDRAFGVERDPYRAADRLSRTSQQAESPAEALASAIRLLRWSTNARGVAVEAGEERYSDGRLGARPRSLPLSWQGESAGTLLVSGGVGTGREQLTVMAKHLAELAHAVRLAEDLRRSRERIRATRDQERRRLARELHDGLGPALTGVVMMLDAARRAPDPALLERTQDELRATVVSVRSLVAGLRPPVLDDLGLECALREAADVPGVEVDLVVSAGELPPEVELAAYRIVLEALTNVRRHAGATRAVVRLSGEDGVLRVRVDDDGAGLPSSAVPGVGLTSMLERATEVGGSCAVEPRPGGGTSVEARLPL
ncbi:sensor histidine kinase [Nonomuraea soli]|uniref:Signal transduction histidine kinase n=1 Tax=Nonomuraea soli TaxID=1032476 RepID=A0A7W0CNC2_9ACTN|nr:sensor histidine kinase [Nonomuraea soli]MBA2894110.1 signal transduction histidine kinase [Nonomuraea soli]